MGSYFIAGQMFWCLDFVNPTFAQNMTSMYVPGLVSLDQPFITSQDARTYLWALCLLKSPWVDGSPGVLGQLLQGLPLKLFSFFDSEGCLVLQSVTLYLAQALSNLTKAVSSDEDADPAKARAFGDTLLIGLFAAANLPRPLNWIYKKPVTAQILACVTPLYLFLTIQFGSCPFSWLIGLIISPDGRLTLSIVTIAMVLSTCIRSGQ